jgi:hypothetical protein
VEVVRAGGGVVVGPPVVVDPPDPAVYAAGDPAQPPRARAEATARAATFDRLVELQRADTTS